LIPSFYNQPPQSGNQIKAEQSAQPNAAVKQPVRKQMSPMEGKTEKTNPSPVTTPHGGMTSPKPKAPSPTMMRNTPSPNSLTPTMKPQPQQFVGGTNVPTAQRRGKTATPTSMHNSIIYTYNVDVTNPPHFQQQIQSAPPPQTIDLTATQTVTNPTVFSNQARQFVQSQMIRVPQQFNGTVPSKLFTFYFYHCSVNPQQRATVPNPMNYLQMNPMQYQNPLQVML
jgi:hypothetical protein